MNMVPQVATGKSINARSNPRTNDRETENARSARTGCAGTAVNGVKKERAVNGVKKGSDTSASSSSGQYIAKPSRELLATDTPCSGISRP